MFQLLLYISTFVSVGVKPTTKIARDNVLKMDSCLGADCTEFISLY